jgi:hypothetical protein
VMTAIQENSDEVHDVVSGLLQFWLPLRVIPDVGFSLFRGTKHCRSHRSCRLVDNPTK